MIEGVEGVEQVLANLNKEIAGIENRTPAGLLAAGMKVLRRSDEYLPVEYGNLKASGYARKAQTETMACEVGYTASYAVYVHENMEQKLKGKPRPSGLGVYWGPAGGPKFLERAVIELQGEIVDTIAHYAGARSSGVA